MNEQEVLERMIEFDEGFRSKPYLCTENKLTIGIGRNIEDVGITKDEALYMLKNDIKRVVRDILATRLCEFEKLSPARYAVLINMGFNMGVPKLKKFKRMWDAINNQDWNQAAYEMIDSKWATQVGDRAVRLSNQMRSGEWQYGKREVYN